MKPEKKAPTCTVELRPCEDHVIEIWRSADGEFIGQISLTPEGFHLELSGPASVDMGVGEDLQVLPFAGEPFSFRFDLRPGRVTTESGVPTISLPA